MTKQAIRSVSVMVALILVVGCTKTVEIRIDENHKGPKEMVVGAVLESGEEIAYDSLGGRYHSHANSVVGRVAGGLRVVTKLGDVKTMLVRDTTDSNSTISRQSAEEFGWISKRGAELAGASVKSLMMDDGRVVTFDGYHGIVNMEKRLIVGTNGANEPVSIPMAEVQSINVKKQNSTVAWLVVGGVAVTVLLLYLAVKGFEEEVKDAAIETINIFGGE